MTSIQKNQLFSLLSSVEWERAGEGIRRKVMSYSDQAMAVFVDFDQGAVGTLHRHPHIQISFVHSGTFQVQVGSMKKTVSEGDFFYVPSNEEDGVVALERGVLIDFFQPMREDFL